MTPKKTASEKGSAALKLKKQAEAILKGRRKKAATPLTQKDNDSQRLIHQLEVHQIELEMQNEELLRARAEAEEAYRKYTDLYDFAPTGYLTIALDGMIRDINLAGAMMLGLPRATIIKRRLGVFVSSGSLPAFSFFLEKLLSGEGKERCEVSFIYKGGSLFWARLEATCFEGGQESRVVLVDITERKHTEDELRKTKAFLTETERIGKVGGWEVNIDTMQQTWTEEIYRIHEVDKDHQPTLEDEISFYTPSSRPIIKRAVQRAIEHGEPFDEELEITTAKGNHRWVHAIGKADLDRRRIFGFFQDITERKQAEEARRIGEAKYQDIFENAPVGIFQSTPQGRFLKVNPFMAKIFGYDSPQEMVASITNIEKQFYVHPSDCQKFISALNKHQGVSEFISENSCKNGTSIWTQMTVRTQKDENGEILYYEGFAIDISERIQAEAALHENEGRLQQAQKIARLGIWDWDLASDVTIWSGEMFNIYGITAETFTGRGRDYINFTHPDDRPMQLANIENSFKRAANLQTVVNNTRTNTAPDPQQFRIIRPDGSVCWVEGDAVTVVNESGEPVKMIGTLVDITERKQAEAVLQARLRLSQFADSHTLDELMQKTLDEAEALTDSQIGFFHFLEADQKTLLLQMWSTNTLQNMCKAEGKGQHYSVDQAGVWVDCVYTRAPVIHNDYASLTHRKGLPQGHAPVSRILVVPILREDQIVVIMGVGNKTAHYDQHDVKVVSELANAAWDVVQRKRAEEALHESKELFSLFMRHSPIYAFIKEVTPIESRVVQASDNYLDMIGISGRDMIGKTMQDLFPPEAAAQFTADDWAVVSNGEVLKLDEDLNGRHYTTIKFPIVKGNKTLLAGYTIDITEQTRAQEALSKSEERFRKAFLSSPVGVAITRASDGEYIDANEAFSKITGYSHEELVSQTSLKLNITTRGQRQEYIRQVREKGSIRDQEMVLRNKSGESHLVLGSMEVIELNHETCVLSTAIDITDRKLSETKLQQLTKFLEEANAELHTALEREKELAHTDSLTGIYNRRYLFELAEHEFELATRYQQPLSAIMFDIDHFKEINDTFGHAVGDQALQIVAQIASTELRSADVIGRYGGEEFMIVLPMTNAKQAYQLAERIRKGVEAMRLPTEKGDAAVTLSIGVTEMSDASSYTSIEEVFRNADRVMYLAKDAGRNQTKIGT